MSRITNIPKIFFSFLIASFLIWLLINLSKEYETKATYTLKFEGLSQDKIFQDKPSDKIDVQVKANGFKLFTSKFKSTEIVVSLDKVKKKNRTDYYVLPNLQKREIQNQLTSGVELIEVLKDTLHLKLGSLSVKKVPVVLAATINYKPGFGFSKMTISPDSIMISGPDLQLREIKEVKTEKVNFEDISEDIKKPLSIQLLEKYENMKYSNTSVNIEVAVDKYTEGTYDIPVEILNVPKGTTLNIYPKKVKVTYKVGLKNFNKISEDSFEVICDYKEMKVKGLTYLVPKFKSKPNLISSSRITPQKIDFLIHK